MKFFKVLAGLAVLALLAAGCAGSKSSYMGAKKPDLKNRVVAVAPLINLTTYPRAGLIVGQILGVELRRRTSFKVISMDRVLAKTQLSELELEELKDLGPHMQAAKELGADMLLKGGVTEYRYIPGVYDRPSVGIVLELVDLKRDRVIWSASVARSGHKFRTNDLTLSQLTSELCAEALSELAD